MSKRVRSAKSATSTRSRRRTSKPGRANQPVTTINTIHTTAEPTRLVGITPPTITFVHFQNETRVYVDGILRRTVDRPVGHHIQHTVEAIEATGAVKIAEQRLDGLVNADALLGSLGR